MFDNEGNEHHHLLVEDYDYLIWERRVLGRLRVLNGPSPRYELELLYIGNIAAGDDRSSFEEFPFSEVAQVLCEAHKLARATTGHKGLAWFSSMTFHWPD